MQQIHVCTRDKMQKLLMDISLSLGILHAVEITQYSPTAEEENQPACSKSVPQEQTSKKTKAT